MTDLILPTGLEWGYPLGVTTGVKGVYPSMWYLGVGSGHKDWILKKQTKVYHTRAIIGRSRL